MKKRSMLVGALIGSSVALLLAPHSGKKTRSKLKYKGEEFVDECRTVGKKACKRGNKNIVKASKQAKVLVVKARGFRQK